jgi:hypothetical protein
MITNRYDLAVVIQQAVLVFLVNCGTAGAQTADRDGMTAGPTAAAPVAAALPPSPDCPQIARVCALLADPDVRDHVGLAEYAWDFNAPDRVSGLEEVPRSGPERRFAGVGQ